MTDKQIIIDRVNVAECVRLQDDEISCDLGGECKGWENCYYKQLKRKEQELKNICKAFDIEYLIDKETGNLIGRCNKLYKKEQECEALQMSENKAGEIIAELQAYKDVNEDFKTAWKELKAENEELKKIINEAKSSSLNLKSFLVGEAIQNEYEEQLEQLKQTLAEIKEITEPYKMTIKKICGNCKKYDDCHACCYKDINCYKYTSSKTDACEEFTYLDKFVPNILANSILQKISGCGVENAR